MAIGAFGIDPASKFATELQSLEIWRKPYRGDRAPPTVWNTVIRYRERAAIRSGRHRPICRRGASCRARQIFRDRQTKGQKPQFHWQGRMYVGSIMVAVREDE
jgi:hypothetical protein